VDGRVSTSRLKRVRRGHRRPQQGSGTHGRADEIDRVTRAEGVHERQQVPGQIGPHVVVADRTAAGQAVAVRVVLQEPASPPNRSPVDQPQPALHTAADEQPVRVPDQRSPPR
jgi:hypothetical protein